MSFCHYTDAVSEYQNSKLFSFDVAKPLNHAQNIIIIIMIIITINALLQYIHEMALHPL